MPPQADRFHSALYLPIPNAVSPGPRHGCAIWFYIQQVCRRPIVMGAETRPEDI